MSEDLLEGFPVRLRWPVAWGDLDAFGHANNTAYFRWFESVRIHYFAAIGWHGMVPDGGVGPILAHTSCTFRAPVTFPDDLDLGARVEAVQGDRFTMRYRAVSLRQGRVAAEGDGRIVAFHYGTGAKAPGMPAPILAAIAALEGK